MSKTIEQQLDNLTKAIQIQGRHFSSVNKSILEVKSEQKEHTRILKENTVELKSHNGRLRKVEEWRQQIIGGKNAIKSVWAVLGIFVIAGIWGTFNTYIAVAKLPTTEELNKTIELQVNKVIKDEMFSILQVNGLIE